MLEKYLVLIETVVSQDLGHCTILNEAYWVEALNKQKAAAAAALHVRERYITGHMRDRVVRVLAKKDWGERYFSHIKAEL